MLLRLVYSPADESDVFDALQFSSFIHTYNERIKVINSSQFIRKIHICAILYGEFSFSGWRLVPCPVQFSIMYWNCVILLADDKNTFYRFAKYITLNIELKQPFTFGTSQ